MESENENVEKKRNLYWKIGKGNKTNKNMTQSKKKTNHILQ